MCSWFINSDYSSQGSQSKLNTTHNRCFTSLCGLSMLFIAPGIKKKMQMYIQFTSCLTIFDTRSMSFMSLRQFHYLSSIMLTFLHNRGPWQQYQQLLYLLKNLKKYGERNNLKKARRNKSEDFKITFKKDCKRTSIVSFRKPHTPHLKVKEEI